METTKMLALSTGHMREETLENMLNIEGVIAYEKGDYGFFVYVPDRLDLEDYDIPEDLFACLSFAMQNEFGWINFDRDVEPIAELRYYC